MIVQGMGLENIPGSDMRQDQVQSWRCRERGSREWQ